MIEAVALQKKYSALVAVDALSFKIAPGEVVGLLGPNGAGKTTTLRLLTGFMPPSSGTASIGGFDIVKETRQAKRLIGYLPENPPLYPEMTVHSYLNFIAGLRGVPRHQIKGRIEQVIEKTNLMNVRQRLIGHLSKGYRQRVGLAQALIAEPKVLILDEPTIGLDPNQILEIRELIKQLAGEMTIILSSHILQEVSAVCQRVIIINRGRIVADDSIANLSGRAGKTEFVVSCSGPKEAMWQKLLNLEGVESVKAVGSTLEDIFLAVTKGDPS